VAITPLEQPARTRARSLSRSRLHLPAWRDPALAAFFFLLTLQLRRPYKMRFPYAWDSLLFVRAVDHFNATIHQPQPPGYLFYVSSARLLDLLIGDPHRALVWVSVLASAAAVAALYLLVSLLYDSLTGAVAAGLLATAPVFWFYGEIAYPYTTLGAGSVVLALLALALRRRLLPGVAGTAALAGAFGLLGGFRQDLLLFLAPLFVVAIWGRPPRHWLAAVAAGALGILAWLLPTAALSEGLAKYWQATSAQGGGASGGSSPLTGGWAALWFNARAVAVFLERGLGFALPPLLYFALRLLLLPRRTLDRSLLWILLWIAPPLGFYLLAHIGDYGYTFSVLPALLVLAARGAVLAARDAAALAATLWARLRRRAVTPRVRRAGAVTLALLLAAAPLAANAAFFLRRSAQFTVAGIACFDATMEERLWIMGTTFPAEQTLVFSAGYYQHARYFLPQYPAWLYDPADGPVAERVVPPDMRSLVLFDETARPDPAQAADFRHATLPCNGKPFYYIAVREGDIARFDGSTGTLAIERR
jgi:hypothetical protein